MTGILTDSLYGIEGKLEREARAEGIAKYRSLAQKAVKRGDGPELKPVERLLVAWFNPLRNLISAEKKAISEGRPGLNRRCYGPVLLGFNTARLALTTLHETMSLLLNAPSGTTPIKISLAIARSLNAQVNHRIMRNMYNAGLREHRAKETGGRYIHPAWDALMKTDTRRIRVRPTNRVAARFIADARWSMRLQAQIGAALLNLFDRVASVAREGQPFTSVFRKVKRIEKNRPKWFWRLSDAAADLIEHGHEIRQSLVPRYMPMVVKPMPWTEKTIGGYLTLPVPIIKRQRPKHGEIENEQTREALNVINSQSWRVNRFVLNVARELADTAGDIAGIPRLEQLSYPPRPADYATNEEVKRLYKGQCAHIFKKNREIASEATTFKIKLDTAIRMREYEKIWFPHQFDFRTRSYPMPILFNHQGDDICRGLLEFAEPVDCTGERAQFWLRVHLANCCGWDKVSFEERVKWCNSNMDNFAGWVDRPLENTGWMEADDPFQALAAARAVIEPEHGAYLPVGIDGSNNALQHYAAMIRCPDAARMVNVLPSDEPQDFYYRVAGQVEAIVGTDADSGVLSAKRLDGMITRKLVKQTAMTTYYGVTHVGARRQMSGQLKELGFDAKNLFPASRYLSGVVLEATERSCPTVHEALAWLRKCARLICDSGKPVAWTTPMGVEVEQPYLNITNIQVRTPFGRLCIPDERALEPKACKQIDGFPPNFVHSIDSAHLMSCAIACHDKGMAFAGVHDKLVSHAANMDDLSDIAREQFVEVHQEPRLHRLADELTERYELDFPPPPKLGTLDLAQVLQSPYLFA